MFKHAKKISVHSDMPNVETTMLKGQPDVVDEITTSDGIVHIERMDKHSYYCRIGQNVFKISSANPRKGPGITIKSAYLI